jgi:hypothetical protein
MKAVEPQYDVAISFLSKDGSTAAALRDRLSEGLSVFFYPRRPPLEKADSPDVLSAHCRRRNLVNTPIDFAPRCAMLTQVGPPIKT